MPTADRTAKLSRHTKESRLTDIVVEQSKFDPTLSVNGQYNRTVNPLNRPVFGGTGAGFRRRARRAVAEGFEAICATPHVRHDHDVRIGERYPSRLDAPTGVAQILRLRRKVYHYRPDVVAAVGRILRAMVGRPADPEETAGAFAAALVGGELARGAFRWGFETYGFDIVRRYAQLIAIQGGSYLWYYPAGNPGIASYGHRRG